MENGSKTICFEEISLGELKPLVEFAFGDDPKLMSEYQQMKTEFDETVMRNMRNIMESRPMLNLRFYKLIFDNVPVGFTVADISIDLLFSFGINIKYRTREIKKAWFYGLRNLFNDYFKTVLWNQNKRAINFMVRNGMRVFVEDKDVTVLTFSKY